LVKGASAGVTVTAIGRNQVLEVTALVATVHPVKFPASNPAFTQA
jgi:hypothetical protein